MTGPPATGPGRAAAGWPSRVLPAASREIVTDCLAVIDDLAPLTERIDGELGPSLGRPVMTGGGSAPRRPGI